MRAHLRKSIGPAAALVAAAAMWWAMPAGASGFRGPEYFPNVPLTTQDGKVVQFYDDLLKDKAVVVNLIYTECSASCPLETAKLSQVQRILGDRVGKDIFFYSISIDPKHDTPEVLKAYAAKFHARPGWLFLTGKEDDIKLVSKKLGLASLTDAANRDGHQPSLMIGRDATGQWMRNSAVDNPRFLATTILHFLDGYKAANPARSYAEIGPLQNVGKGEYLFKSRCASCHTIGRGDAVGPDLLNATKLRDRAWLSRYIARPDLVLAAGDPIAKQLFAKYKDVRMPNLDLSAEEVDALLPYIEQQSKGVEKSAPKGPLSAG
jgi:protein SCO1/2